MALRLSGRALLPAANQHAGRTLWQDPVFGYFETHGKMEFKAGETYDLSDAEKRAVLHRHRVKEILKKEYLRREFDPTAFKYKEGIVMDPAMMRWYAADASQTEHFRWTPKTVITIAGGFFLLMYIYTRAAFQTRDRVVDACRDGRILWWDRQKCRLITTAGHSIYLPGTLNEHWQ